MFAARDAGRLYESAAWFNGGKIIEDAKSNLRGLELASGEGAEIKARFPMISPGASLVSLSAPSYPKQSAWGLENLPLKEGPFDPPLPVLPLLDASLSAPEAEPAAVAAAVLSTSTPAPVAVSSKPTAAPAPEATPEPPPVAISAEPSPTPDPEMVDPPLPPVPEPPSVSTPVASPQQTPANTENPTAKLQRQAYLARQNALQERTRCRGRLGGKKGLLKRGLFESAEIQRQYGEQAQRAGEYAQAVRYFEQAVRIYKSIR